MHVTYKGLDKAQEELAEMVINDVYRDAASSTEEKLSMIYDELNNSGFFKDCIITFMPIGYRGAMPSFSLLIQKPMKGEPDGSIDV